MISQDETLVNIPRWCHDCGSSDREHLALVEDSEGRRRCHRPNLYCNACNSTFRPSAPVPDDAKGWEVHACAPCPFCSAPREWKNGYCSCPEGKVDEAKRKADQDARNEAIEKLHQEAADQAKLDRALFEKERVAKRLQEEERMDEFSKAGIAAERKVKERRELETSLRDREQAVKAREISRRERRQDGFDAISAEATEPAAELTLADFETPMDGSDIDLVPTALLTRKDGATLLYEGKLNFCFGIAWKR